jgi:hypothetical protein
LIGFVTALASSGNSRGRRQNVFRHNDDSANRGLTQSKTGLCRVTILVAFVLGEIMTISQYVEFEASGSTRSTVETP